MVRILDGYDFRSSSVLFLVFRTTTSGSAFLSITLTFTLTLYSMQVLCIRLDYLLFTLFLLFFHINLHFRNIDFHSILPRTQSKYDKIILFQRNRPTSLQHDLLLIPHNRSSIRRAQVNNHQIVIQPIINASMSLTNGRMV